MMNGSLPVRVGENKKITKALLYHRSWSFFIGLAGTLLGLTFLGLNLSLIKTVPFIQAENWWGVCIIIAALGGLLTAILLLIGGHSLILALINLAAAALIAFVGYVALNNLDWNLINMAFPVLLILAGIGLIVGFGSKKDAVKPDID